MEEDMEKNTKFLNFFFNFLRNFCKKSIFLDILQKAFKKGRWSGQKRTDSVLKGTA